MDLQVSIPGVGVIPSLQNRARFYRDERGIDMVVISAVGSKDTSICRVEPEHMAQFKNEWDAYCDGRPPSMRPGTPLKAVEGVNDARAEMYVSHNIHNAEELAAISDGQCQSLGHGVLTDRKAARLVVARNTLEARSAQHDAVLKAAEKIGPGKVEEAGVAALGEKIDQLATGINALVGLLSAQAEKKKPGRPPKEVK